MVFNLQTYKKTKIVSKDLEEILKHILIIKKLLAKYTKYTPVKDLYTNILHNEALLYGYLKKCREIVKNKGSMDEIKNPKTQNII